MHETATPTSPPKNFFLDETLAGIGAIPEHSSSDIILAFNLIVLV